MIDLHHNMGAKANVWVVNKGPIGELKCQLDRVIADHASIVGADQVQRWSMVFEGLAQLLHRTWSSYLLQASSSLRRGGLARTAETTAVVVGSP